MKFLLEVNNPDMKMETFLWQDLLDEKTCQHTYDTCEYAELSRYTSTNDCTTTIPLGSILFTNRFFQLVHNITQMNPIEIPPCLRDPKFLGRQYKIVPGSQVPKDGYYFLKDASSFKTYAYMGPLNERTGEQLHANRPYVVSSPLDVLSEYRVYFVRRKIYAIEYYNGNPTYFPDCNNIAQANLRYSQCVDYPQSYTMDVMVTEEGTFITEIHPVLFSCGLYTTILGTDFLDGYIDSFNYILHHNTKIVLT